MMIRLFPAKSSNNYITIFYNNHRTSTEQVIRNKFLKHYKTRKGRQRHII